MVRARRELFRGFHKDCVQRKIRRAEAREHLNMKTGTRRITPGLLPLVVMTRRRQNLPPQPLNWFRGLITAFGKDLKDSGGLQGLRANCKHSHAFAQEIHGLQIRLQRCGIQQSWRHARRLENRTGGSRPGVRTTGTGALRRWQSGLVAFKEHLGASGRLINYWTYPQGSEGLSSRGERSLFGQAVSAAPDFALERWLANFYTDISGKRRQK